MAVAKLEHVNVTVSDPLRTAEMLCRLFDWHIRWRGASQMGGSSVHVGTAEDYVALYTPETRPLQHADSDAKGGLNHIGIVVDDLDAAERRVLDAGYHTHSHYDYEPGRRFYFDDEDGIEFEVVSYRG